MRWIWFKQCTYTSYIQKKIGVFRNRLSYIICFYVWKSCIEMTRGKKIVIKRKKTTVKKIEASGHDISGDYNSERQRKKQLEHKNGLSRKCELNTTVTNAKGFILSCLSHLNGGILFLLRLLSVAPFLSMQFLLLTLIYFILSAFVGIHLIWNKRRL